uniref:Uncharacterized protein n=1 Tax=Amphimedon queenslandica TaxID=400682 RepID=A0A1X7V760_AMPQE
MSSRSSSDWSPTKSAEESFSKDSYVSSAEERFQKVKGKVMWKDLPTPKKKTYDSDDGFYMYTNCNSSAESVFSLIEASSMKSMDRSKIG